MYMSNKRMKLTLEKKNDQKMFFKSFTLPYSHQETYQRVALSDL